MFGKLSSFKRASRFLAKTGLFGRFKHCTGVCFRDILGKLGSQMWVRIWHWFGSRFGVPFGRFLGSFWDTFGPCGHPLGVLLDHVRTLWGSVLWVAFGPFG